MSFFSIASFPAARRVFILAAILSAVGQSRAFAEDEVDIGEIEVRESKPTADAPTLDRTAASSVIKPEESKDLNTTVPELLEQTAGVHIKRYGGLDDFSAISLRGSQAAQVQIYLDDIPLATSQGELVDLTLIPLAMIERIEVYRGGSPGTLPDATAGGVVILKTKARPAKFGATLRNTAGSFFSYKGTASAAGPLGRFSYIAAYERSQSDGDFEYIDNNGTTFNAADDRLVARANNDFASNSLYSKFMIDLGKGAKLTAANVFFNKDRGVPGLGNMQSNTARLKSWRDLVTIGFDKDFSRIKGLSGHADIFFDFLNDQFTDQLGQIGLGQQQNDDDTYRFGEGLRASYAIGSHQLLKGFAAHRSEFFKPTNRAASPPHGPMSMRNTISVGAEDEIVLFADRLTLVPSIRLTNLFNDLYNEDPSSSSAVLSNNSRGDHQISAKAGLSLRLVDELYFKGNFYRGFRNPTFSELFGDRGTIVGNPALSAEESVNFDAGLSFKHDKEEQQFGAAIEAIYFRNSVDALIQFLQTSQFTIRAHNMAKALIQGAEISARARWKERLTAYASYTFQDAKDASSLPATSGKYLPGRPRHELAMGLAWNERWLDWFSTRLSAELNYMSGNYLDTQNLLLVENRSLVSTGLAAIFAKGITLSFAVRNLLDDRISDLVGYPLPGRSYWGTVEFKL